MPHPGQHAMLPETAHDDDARLDFIYALKEHVASDVARGNRVLYEREVVPAFERRHGRSPADRHEVRGEMRGKNYWRMFGSLSRLYQELKQDYGQVIVERQSADLNARARKYHNAPAGGSLRLNPGLPIPRYQTAADLHCMPGSYHTDRGDDDVWAGAVYDPGVYYFAMGALGPYNEDMGVAMCRWLAENFPKLNPRRILDMGCTVGHSTTPYALAFPDAEIHAIDVAAPVLRYAHARAQSMGFGINFSQQDAERTNFDDASFDLVVSHILLHETSRRAVFNIMKESRRLLRSGGLAIHIEAPIQNDQLTPLDAFSQDWATHYNAEPFWGTLHDMDLRQPLREAGFSEDEIIFDKAAKVFGGGAGLTGSGTWLLIGGRK